MISISHWGMFPVVSDMHCMISADKPVAYLPTSFFVSRQDKPKDPKKHPFY